MVDRTNIMEQADGLAQQGRPLEAFALYDDALEGSPADVELLSRASVALLDAGAQHESYLYAEQAKNAAQGDPEPWFAMAVAAVGGGQGELALEALAGYVGAGGQQDEAYHTVASLAAYYDLDIVGALEHARSASGYGEAAFGWTTRLEAITSDHQALVEVARSHCRSGRFGIGAELFVHALTLGDSYEARLYGGRAMLAAGRIDNAVALLVAAADMRPDDADVASDLEAARSIQSSLTSGGES